MNAGDFLSKTAELAVRCGQLERQVGDLQLTLKQYSNAHRDLEEQCGPGFVYIDGTVADNDVVFQYAWSDTYGSHEWLGVFLNGGFLPADLLAHEVESTAERALAAWERAEREANEDARRAA